MNPTPKIPSKIALSPPIHPFRNEVFVNLFFSRAHPLGRSRSCSRSCSQLPKKTLSRVKKLSYSQKKALFVSKWEEESLIWTRVNA